MKVSLPEPSNDFCPQTFFTYGTYKEDGTPNFGLFCWLSYCWDGELCVTACIGGEVQQAILRGDTFEQVSRKHPLRLLQMNGEYLVLRKSGYKEEIDALRDELKERGLLMELSRSGSIILHRETVEESMDGIL